jgi:hypothetical protein
VLADATLSRLFPNVTEHGGPTGFVYRSTGSGSGVQLIAFASLIIESSWRSLQPLSRTPTIDEFLQAVTDTLHVIRRAILKKSTVVRALVGLAGIQLADRQSIDLPFGRLRAMREGDRAFMPPVSFTRGTVVAQQATTGSLSDPNGNAVLDIQVPYRIKVTPPDPAPHDWPIELVSDAGASKCVETLRLALLLSGDGAVGPVAHIAWRIFIDPFDVGNAWTAWDTTRLPGFTPTALDDDALGAVAGWVRRVHVSRGSKIDIAVRRTLQAASERSDPSDALIDCVVAWENLVGSSEGEPTLRVSSALGWLLGGGSADQRLSYQRAASSMYALRSKIVHGNKVLTPKEAAGKRDEALALTMRILRTLFERRPDLLEDCKDGNERSLRLILDRQPAPIETSQIGSEIAQGPAGSDTRN